MLLASVTVILNLPSTSVEVPVVVFLTLTPTPTKGWPLSSVTVPLTLSLVWAKDEAETSRKATMETKANASFSTLFFKGCLCSHFKWAMPSCSRSKTFFINV